MAFGALSVSTASLLIFSSPVETFVLCQSYSTTSGARKHHRSIFLALGGLTVLDWKSFRHEAVVDRSQNIDFQRCRLFYLLRALGAKKLLRRQRWLGSVPRSFVFFGCHWLRCLSEELETVVQIARSR